MIQSTAALTALAAAVALAACGSSDAPTATITAAASPPTRQAPAPSPSGSLPPGVPLRGDGPAGASERRVIDAWLTALRAGDVAKAARYFAEPAKVQNGTPLLTLRSRAARVAFNAAFPCGAKTTRAQHAARGFTIVTFVLTERRGGDCGDGTGGKAFSAIRVSDDRIVEWYRLPDDGSKATPPTPDATDPGIGIA